MLCHNGKNNEVGGIPVIFDDEQLTFRRNEPCSGCLWRHVINFAKNPEYEGFINLLQRDPKFIENYYRYINERQKASDESRDGGIFSWENLLIERYPNISATALLCRVGKNS